MLDHKHLLLTTLAGAGLGLTSGCGYCIQSEWSQLGEFWQQNGARRIPVDAAPWLLRPCGHDTPLDCALIVDGERFPVDVDDIGDDACNLAYDEQLDQTTPSVIQTLRPTRPLPPGATARLDCAGDDQPYTSEYYDVYSYSYGSGSIGDEPTLQIRTSNDPAAPPGELTDLAIHYTRGDPNTCGAEGNYLELSLDFAATFLQEGGYIEVLYPNRQVIAVTRPREGEDAAWLPASHGPLTLTPVAIDGQRGEPVVVDEQDMTEDAVYIPGCNVAANSSPAGLLALAWVIAVRRRRRSA